MGLVNWARFDNGILSGLLVIAFYFSRLSTRCYTLLTKVRFSCVMFCNCDAVFGEVESDFFYPFSLQPARVIYNLHVKFYYIV